MYRSRTYSSGLRSVQAGRRQLDSHPLVSVALHKHSRRGCRYRTLRATKGTAIAPPGPRARQEQAPEGRPVPSTRLLQELSLTNPPHTRYVRVIATAHQSEESDGGKRPAQRAG